MEIGLVILHADPARGGAERYTVDLARDLAARGHRVTIISATRADSVPESIGGVRLRMRGVTRLGRYRAFLDALDEHLGSHRYDIVHAMLPVRRCDVYHPHAGIAAESIRAGHRKHAHPLKR